VELGRPDPRARRAAPRRDITPLGLNRLRLASRRKSRLSAAAERRHGGFPLESAQPILASKTMLGRFHEISPRDAGYSRGRRVLRAAGLLACHDDRHLVAPLWRTHRTGGCSRAPPAALPLARAHLVRPDCQSVAELQRRGIRLTVWPNGQ